MNFALKRTTSIELLAKTPTSSQHISKIPSTSKCRMIIIWCIGMSPRGSSELPRAHLTSGHLPSPSTLLGAMPPPTSNPTPSEARPTSSTPSPRTSTSRQWTGLRPSHMRAGRTWASIIGRRRGSRVRWRATDLRSHVSRACLRT